MDRATDSDFEKHAVELGLRIPAVPPSAGLFVPAVRTGNLLFCSGQGPYLDGANRYVGKVGDRLTLEDGIQAARLCALNCLAEVRWALGSLDSVRRVVQVRGFVNSAPGFAEQPKVMNGASQLLIDLFGDAGRHARCALGTSSLPGDVAVEVEMIVEAVDEGETSRIRRSIDFASSLDG